MANEAFISKSQFQREIYDYYKREGRDLPWRRTTDPYRILVSEFMLQQTQVDRVRDKYQKFINLFPDFRSLAASPLCDVLAAWQGLGYNRRAVALHKTAAVVMNEHNGILPSDPDILITFPGIGRGTAGAISAFAFNQPVSFIETNIRRVFLHFFFRRHRRVIHDSELMPLIESMMDRDNAREWYGALMDYGSMLARTYPNPNRRSVHYAKQSKFEGSDRQIRGRVLASVLNKSGSRKNIVKEIGVATSRVEKVLASLEREGFIQKRGQKFFIAR